MGRRNNAGMSNSDSDAGGFETVAAAIRLLRAQALEQPSLPQIAQRLGVAPATLQRRFSELVGVSPKRFLQFLTKEHAIRLLRESHDVLSAALDSGLSSPGRLHDLLVSCEALTPGEIRRRGAGIRLGYAYGSTPLGRALAATTARGLAYLGFVGADGKSGASGAADARALEDLAGRWPGADLVYDPGVAGTIGQVFAGWRRGARPLHLLLRGTNFQIKVWEALLAIPEATLVSYSQVAAAIGRPEAVRAVAGAVARNPISILVPCHRVVRDSGELGGYHWGLERKIALIALESARRSRAEGASVRSPAEERRALAA